MSRKVVVIGTGMVGANYAYSMVNQNITDEIVLLDLNENLANAHANDMADGDAFLPNTTRIKVGTYDDCKDADIVCITAGAPQKEGQTRLDLAVVNANITKRIVSNVMESNFDGILLIAINPVDVMTYVAQKVSKLDESRVIGSGTNLDSARLKRNISNYLNINSDSIHALIIGEHGDSSLPIWSSAYIGPKPMLDYIKEKEKYNFEDLQKCFEDARDAAYEIIKYKGSTYFGIGNSLAKITKDILSDQDRVLPVSVAVNNMYGLGNIYISLPAIIGDNGIKEILKLNLTKNEQMALEKSAKAIQRAIELIEEQEII